MPERKPGETQDEWLERCIPAVLEDGSARDRDQAVAMCISMFKEQEKGNTLKAISATDDTLRVANRIIVFGGRDLEGILSDRKNADGSTGEWFAPDTDIESEYTRLMQRLPVNWEHGRDADGPGRQVLGYVDWTTAKALPDGIWVERVLDRRNRYVQLLEQLIAAGLVGTSSEADPEGVQKAPDGKIIRWPLIGDALTVSPMEPRMLTQNALQAAKALGLLAEPEPEADAEAREGAEAGQAMDDGNTTQTQSLYGGSIMAEMTLTDERLSEIINGAVAKAIDEMAKAAPVNPAPVRVIEDDTEAKARNPELPPFKSLGEQLMAIYKAGPDGRNATPQLIKAHKEAAKAISGMSEQVPADGGFLVQTDFAGMLMKPDMSGQPILARVQRIPISANANSVKLNAIAETSRATGSRWGGVRGYWLNEADQKTSSKPAFRELRLELHKVAALAYATDELLQDAAALGAVIGEAARQELTFLVENAIINGSGAGQPLGILNSGALVTVAKEAGQAADTVLAENVINMWSRRWVRGSNYVWLINQDVTPQLIRMGLNVGVGGQLVYMPAGGLSGAPYGTLFGAPVLEVEYCDTVGDLGDIILADLSQYLLADKGGVQEAQSIHIRFDYDETAFRFVYRVDGQPAWASAVTPFQSANTISPFVALAARA